MAMSPEFRLESSNCRFYSWTTDTPVEGERKTTDSFTFQECECDFNLERSDDSYELFIFCFEEPSKAFDVTVYFGCGTNYISYPKETVERQGRIRLWESKICKILQIVPEFDHHECLQFKIALHASDPDLEQVKTDNKSIQTSPYLDVSPCMESLSQDLSKLFDAQEDSQHSVELKCGDHILVAHRSILISRSEVFSAMLQSDMVEGRSGRVNIHDIDFTIFQEFIRYLYTGKLPELTLDKAKELYEAGDKYAVKSLMKRCANFFTENLTLENFCECLALADAHNDQNLKEAIMSDISEKRVPVNDEHWIAFSKNHPLLAVEVLTRSYNLLCPK